MFYIYEHKLTNWYIYNRIDKQPSVIS